MMRTVLYKLGLVSHPMSWKRRYALLMPQLESQQKNIEELRLVITDLGAKLADADGLILSDDTPTKEPNPKPRRKRKVTKTKKEE